MNGAIRVIGALSVLCAAAGAAGSLLGRLVSDEPPVCAAAAREIARPETKEQLPAIVEALRRDERLDLRLAAEVLFRTPREGGGPRQALIEGLRAKDRFVRAAACYWLGLRGEAESAVSALIPLLEDEDKHPRNFAAAALAMAGPAAAPAVEPLRKALLDDGSEEMAFQYVRASAALALGAIGEAARPAAGDLVETLEDRVTETHRRHFSNCGHIRAAAAYALARLGVKDGEARRALEEAARVEHPLLGPFAKAALAGRRPGRPQTGEPTEMYEAALALAAAGRRHARDSMVLALGVIGGGAEIRVSRLLDPARGEELQARVTALQALGRVNRDITPTLLTGLLGWMGRVDRGAGQGDRGD